MRLRLFVPNGPTLGVVYLIPGLHFKGPGHPEIERFSAALAHAGILVATPYIPDYIAMRFLPRSMNDAQQGFLELLNHKRRKNFKPCVMSISLGSRLALSVCARQAAQVGSLVSFGAYLDWRKALQFCLSGDEDRPHDPLNRPIIFTALQDHLPATPQHDDVLEAWLRFVRQTWGRQEMKNKAAIADMADILGKEFHGDSLSLFRKGLDLEPGGDQLILEALRTQTPLDWLECKEDLDRISCPLIALHAAKDDVVPCEQSKWLIAAAPSKCDPQAILTGMYSHSGQTIPSPFEAAGELCKLIQIVAKLIRYSSQTQIE